MKYNEYIKGSPKISEIGLGAWQLGKNSDWEAMTDDQAIELVHKSLDLGINYFDTAPNYGNGTSEERLGRALKKADRSKIVINTKFGHSDKGETNYDSSNIRESVEGSLKRLQTDYLDSILLHNPPFSYLDGNSNSHYELFERLIEEGKILGYGASLDTFEEMEQFINTTNGKVIEAFFNIIHQDARRAFKLAEEKGVKIVVKIPLDSGWLSGKYNASSTFSDIRRRWSKEDIITRAQIVDRIKKIIGKDNSLAQTALSFCSSYDAVSTVIPGCKNIKQLNDNYNSIKNKLSVELLKELEKFYNDEIAKLNIPW